MTKAASILLVGMLALTSGGIALAHHAGTMYDRSQQATVKGEVEEWRWSNPHAFLQIYVNDDSGDTELWSFESTSPNILVQQGWRRTSLEPGDEVEVIYNPLKDGSPGGSLVGVVLEDGTRLNARSGSGGGDSASENLKEE